MSICKACGRDYVGSGMSQWYPYCSARCKLDGEKAKALGTGVWSQPGSLKDLASNPGRMKLVIAGTAIVIIIGLIGVAVKGIQNAFSDTKINIVSASCETQERFTSILEEAFSEASVTMIEGEEFTAYARQALAAVKEREHLFKDCVYSVRLPDNVGVYIWFKTENEPIASVYKTE